MKKLVIIIILLLAGICSATEPPKPTKHTYTADRAPKDCEFRGQSLDRVKVKFVPEYESHTFKVRQVEDGEDLTVRFCTTSYSSNRCGQWRIVDSESPDFTVALVTHGEDFTIRVTDVW